MGSSNHGCWLGSYERRHQQTFVEQIHPNDVVFDVGAHVGFYTLLAAKLVGRKGRVIAFEPISQNVAQIRQHLHLNAIENATIMQIALMNIEGETNFSHGPSSSMWHVAHDGTVTAVCSTLDTLTSDGTVPVPNVIKIDVEGVEHAVLKGALRLLRTSHPTILLSTHGPKARGDCCRLLSELGYTLTDISEDSEDWCREFLAQQTHRYRRKTLSHPFHPL